MISSTIFSATSRTSSLKCCVLGVNALSAAGPGVSRLKVSVRFELDAYFHRCVAARHQNFSRNAFMSAHVGARQPFRQKLKIDEHYYGSCAHLGACYSAG